MLYPHLGAANKDLKFIDKFDGPVFQALACLDRYEVMQNNHAVKIESIEHRRAKTTILRRSKAL